MTFHDYGLYFVFLQFSHDGYKKPFAISTTKRDYKAPCEPHVSRCFDRLKSQIIMQRGAIPNDLFLRHHGKNHDCAKITWYDEIYNRRRLKDEHGRMRFPEERTWSVPENEWRPEESDFPLQGRKQYSRIQSLRRFKLIYFIFNIYSIAFGLYYIYKLILKLSTKS